MKVEQVSTDATGNQPPIMEVDDSHIPDTDTTDSVLIIPDHIPKSYRIGFETKLNKSVQVENKQ